MYRSSACLNTRPAVIYHVFCLTFENTKREARRKQCFSWPLVVLPLFYINCSTKFSATKRTQSTAKVMVT